MKLVLFDLDGTLFDTKDVNYYAYNYALKEYGYSVDYEYYCQKCNGKRYTQFLPQIIGENNDIIEQVHKKKKEVYSKYLKYARINEHLIQICKCMKSEYKTAVVTTASKKNCMEILETFHILDLFDLILTQENVSEAKPSPEGFLKAMKHFEVSPEDTIIFEDSDVGIEAAKRSGANYMVVHGYN